MIRADAASNIAGMRLCLSMSTSAQAPRGLDIEFQRVSTFSNCLAGAGLPQSFYGQYCCTTINAQMLDGERIIFDGQRHMYNILWEFRAVKTSHELGLPPYLN